MSGNYSKKEKIQIVLLGISIPFLILLFLYINDNNNEDILEKKFQFGKFTIGEVVSFEYSKSIIDKTNNLDKKINMASIGFVALVFHTSYVVTHFIYKIDGKSYDADNSSEDYPNDLTKESKTGDKYLAVYLGDKSKDCVLLFNYPIKDSTDYIRYSNFFKTHTPRFYNFVYDNDSIKP